MSFPLPAARLIVRYLDDADLVRQRELYQRRLARKTLRRWQSLVLVQRVVRIADQQQHLSHADIPMTETNQRTLQTYQERGFNGARVLQTVRNTDSKVMEQRVRQLVLRDDPALAGIVENGSPEDFLRALAQSPALPALLGLFEPKT